MLAYKDLDEEYYEEWARRRLQASLAQDSREDRLASIYEEVESDMMVRTGQAGAGRGDVVPTALLRGPCGLFSCWAPQPLRISFSKEFQRPLPS